MPLASSLKQACTASAPGHSLELLFLFMHKTAMDRPHHHEVDHLSPVELPINGVLDLHAFSLKDVKTLVPDYLHECRLRGILEARIIYGKGSGALRLTVHAVLKRMGMVARFRLGDETSGGWGATLVSLRAL